MTPEVLARETRSSIEVNRNSKGDYQWVIKRYFEDGHEDDPRIADVNYIDGQLRAQYVPTPEAAS